MVHGILLARIPYSEVEDLVQDVFLLAMRRLSSLKDEKAFPGWLSMIARNQAIDYLRRTPKIVDGLIARDHRKPSRSEEHTSELQSHLNLGFCLLIEKK